MTTIKEIAKLAGVSRGTVDRVLNGRGVVKKETAERVRSIAESLCYSPNRAGKILAVRKKNLMFGYILPTSTTANPFFIEVVRGIESRAAELLEYGISVEIRYAKIDDPSLQAALIDELVAKGIDGLVLVPINHPDVVERIRKLSRAGIPVVTANSDIPDSGRIAYVGSDGFKSGCAAAGLVNLATGGKANVGIIIGNPSLENHTERAAGFNHQIQRCYPNIRIVGSTINYDDDIESFCATQNLLDAHPEIDALFMTGAGIAGTCRAVKGAGLHGKIKIVTHDLTAGTRELLKDGAISATITQQPFVQGAKPLDLLLDYLGMGILPTSDLLYTRIEIRIRENV